ncbi:hypothetical protein SAMN04487781_3119 [Cellulosimicrobium cellulans]|nr:hypothetical protein SAMN04487781_3119 [Cellulosimicrobium cellulans]
MRCYHRQTRGSRRIPATTARTYSSVRPGATDMCAEAVHR